jgi:hypothetical protein
VKGNDIERTEIFQSAVAKVTVVTDGKNEQRTDQKEASQEFIYKGKIERNLIIGYSFLKSNEALHWKATKKK